MAGCFCSVMGAAGTTERMANVEKTPAALSRKLIRRLTKDSARPNELRDVAFRRRIMSIPRGKVATYGQVAAAAGYPLYHRAVARLLRTTPGGLLPWQRVIGSGGEIKLRFEAGAEQRFRLEMEGVRFVGRRVDLASCQHSFSAWEPEYYLRLLGGASGLPPPTLRRRMTGTRAWMNASRCLDHLPG
jgi:methylated-DNA-protein-cysteine methyltransferase-like protein